MTAERLGGAPGRIPLDALDRDGALAESAERLSDDPGRVPARRRGLDRGRRAGAARRRAGRHPQCRRGHPQLRALARVPAGRVLHRGRARGCAQRQARRAGAGGGIARARPRRGAAVAARRPGDQAAAVRLPGRDREPGEVPRRPRSRSRISGRAAYKAEAPKIQNRRVPGRRDQDPLGRGPARGLDPARGRLGARPRRLRRAEGAAAGRAAGRLDRVRRRRPGDQDELRARGSPADRIAARPATIPGVVWARWR